MFARLVIPALAGLFAVAGWGGAPLVAQAHAATQYNLTIVARNNASGTRFSFSMPNAVHAGRVEVKLVNAGTVDHEAQLFRLKPGVSESDFLEELRQVFATTNPAVVAQKMRNLLTHASGAGGSAAIPAGASQEVIENLMPGRYVAACLETTPQGVPHFELGMRAMFTVFGEDEFTAPASRGTIVETDYSIQMPAAIRESQPLTLRVSVADQTHEVQIMSVPTGTTRQQLLNCFQGKACTLAGPPMNVGGAAGLAPGRSQWVELRLKPGTYAAVCFIPDVRRGLPHALLGMVTVFVVEK
ncbi:MAG: hypothetical protein IVW57_16500 [Ktedonobacterales bacterium]|nr:hypothetical protein [Ktedonobacterales bacterium]